MASGWDILVKMASATGRLRIAENVFVRLGRIVSD